jgi:hypothetical protein
MGFKIPPVDTRLLLSEKRTGLSDQLWERRMDQHRRSWLRAVFSTSPSASYTEKADDQI